MSDIGFNQLELALEAMGVAPRTDTEQEERQGNLLLQAQAVQRIANDPEEARQAMFGLDALFKMAVMRIAAESGRGYQEVCDEMLVQARELVGHARKIAHP